MAINETIVTGRKFRKLIDEATRQWQRISFWHKASDCEFDDGKTAEEKLGMINGISSDPDCNDEFIAASIAAINRVKQSFQDGCDTIVAGCTTCGSVPATNSPDDISEAIKNIYDGRYQEGILAATPIVIKIENSYYTCTKSGTMKIIFDAACFNHFQYGHNAACYHVKFYKNGTQLWEWKATPTEAFQTASANTSFNVSVNKGDSIGCILIDKSAVYGSHMSWLVY